MMSQRICLRQKRNASFAKASTSLPYCHGAPLLSQNKCDALDTVLCVSDALSDPSLLYNRICLTDDDGDVTEPIHGDACRNQQAQGACVKEHDTTSRNG